MAVSLGSWIMEIEDAIKALKDHAELAQNAEETQTPITGIESLTQIKKLDDIKKILESAISDTKEFIKLLNPAGMDYFHENGIDRIGIDGKTIYLRNELWASLKKDLEPDQMDLVKAHEEFGSMVKETIHTQSLSGALRRKVESLEINESLQDILGEDIFNCFTIREDSKIIVRTK